MGEKSGIEWTDATWNPVTGCSKVSAGCKYCYAERDFHRPYPGREFTEVRTHPGRLEQALGWKRPRKIFVNSMSDLFHDRVSDEFLAAVFGVMSTAAQHTFQVLTKRPERARQFLRATSVEACLAGLGRRSVDFTSRRQGEQAVAHTPSNETWPLANVQLGVSVEDQETADHRIPVLLQTPAAVRFVSYEPALGPVDFSRYLLDGACPVCSTFSSIAKVWHGRPCPACGSEPYPVNRLDWVIAGGESGRDARPPHPNWFRATRDQCQAAGVAFFFKQWGEFAPYAGDFTDLHLTSAHPAHRMVNGQLMERRGKKQAGRLLDGREWNEFPVAS